MLCAEPKKFEPLTKSLLNKTNRQQERCPFSPSFGTSVQCDEGGEVNTGCRNKTVSLTGSSNKINSGGVPVVCLQAVHRHELMFE
jgi:hypothetical protein